MRKIAQQLFYASLALLLLSFAGCGDDGDYDIRYVSYLAPCLESMRLKS